MLREQYAVIGIWSSGMACPSDVCSPGPRLAVPPSSDSTSAEVARNTDEPSQRSPFGRVRDGAGERLRVRETTSLRC